MIQNIPIEVRYVFYNCSFFYKQQQFHKQPSSRWSRCELLIVGSMRFMVVNRGSSNWLYNDLIYFLFHSWSPNPKD